MASCSRLFSIFLMVIPVVVMMTWPAFAENNNIDNALNNCDELSEFKKALVATGVIEELDPKASYSIFAPTNEYLAKIIKGEPSCLSSQQCKAEMATILRNHIVEGTINLREVAKQKTMVLSSISGHLITIAVLPNGDIIADGNDITMQQPMAGGVMLYEINGLIANPQEHADMHSINLE